MKKLLDEKGSLIIKAIIYQIAMSIFGIMLTMSVLALNENFLWLSGIFSVLFYFALIGAAVNDDGCRDCLRVQGGRAEADPLLGFKYMLISYCPSFLIALAYILLHAAGIDNALTMICNLLTRFFTTGMYMALDRALFADGDTLAAFSTSGLSFLLYQAFSVIVGGLFYFLGMKNIRLTGKKKEK